MERSTNLYYQTGERHLAGSQPVFQIQWISNMSVECSDYQIEVICVCLLIINAKRKKKPLLAVWLWASPLTPLSFKDIIISKGDEELYLS